MTTYSSVLAWRTPWTEEPDGHSPRGLKELDRTQLLSTYVCAHTHRGETAGMSVVIACHLIIFIISYLFFILITFPNAKKMCVTLMVLLLLETHIQIYSRQISICVFVCVHVHKPLGNDEQRRHPMVGEKDTAEISRALDPLSCFSFLRLFTTLGTIASQAPLSMGILQARILECVSMLFSRGSSHIPYISSVAQLCPTLCDPMDCCMQHFLVHPQSPELTQTHVH